VKIILIILVLGVVLTLVAAVYFRSAADDPARWHVDPMTTGAPGGSNSVLIRPEGGDRAARVYDVSPERLAAAIEAVALDEPNTRRIAGGPADLWMTYVQRSAVMGFPDYISVKVLPVEGGASWAAYSRSRYGKSDLGVNGRRMTRWTQALEDRLAP